MKISASQIQAAKMYQKMGKFKAEATRKSGSRPAHEVELSKEAREIQSIRQKIAEAPEVREEKVNELKQAIAKGTYKVPGKDIAEEMFRRAYTDSVLKE